MSSPMGLAGLCGMENKAGSENQVGFMEMGPRKRWKSSALGSFCLQDNSQTAMRSMVASCCKLIGLIGLLCFKIGILPAVHTPLILSLVVVVIAISLLSSNLRWQKDFREWRSN